MNMGRMRDSSVGGGGSARMGTQTGSSVLETTDDGYRDSDVSGDLIQKKRGGISLARCAGAWLR